MDTVNIKALVSKFSIESNKTLNPCNIRFIKGDLLTSLILGFIDGDGSINKQTGREDCLLSVKCHSAWLDNLNYMTQHLVNLDKAYINNQGYARFGLGQSHLVKLKEFGRVHKLPLMKRKWDKVPIIQ